MTDVLVERFAALADSTNDGDWLDVQRRARSKRVRFAVPVALVAAAVVAAAAFAASSGWIFSSQGGNLLGVTHVTVGGRVWRVTLNDQTRGTVSFFIVSASSGRTKSSGGLADATSLRWFGPSFTAASADIPGGQIWAGTTRSSTQRVSITDYAGRVYTAKTVPAPRSAKTPYRFWALAVAGSPAASLTTYNAAGNPTRWRLSH